MCSHTDLLPNRLSLPTSLSLSLYLSLSRSLARSLSLSLALSLSLSLTHTHTHTDKGALTLDALNGPAEAAPKTKPAAAAAGGGSVGRVLAATRKDFLAELGEADVMGGVTAALTLVKATPNQARAGL